jgi:outer membrane protein assembly factor BamB
MKLRHDVIAVIAALISSVGGARAADWPTFRHDAARSGIAGESLELPLVESWIFQSRFAPDPAFGLGYPKPTNWEGGVEKRRVDFDRVDSTVVADGRVYFGSVGDGKIYCLDAATAKVLWTFPTGGPVRLAPTIHNRRVYAGSDDGFVYCLDSTDGSQLWKFRAAPEDHHVIGNGNLISLWPVRTGVLVKSATANGPAIAHFGSGFFPTEGVFVFAVDATTGKLLWKNDRGGESRLGQISPQGYLLATDEQLVVPMARLAPGIYDRLTGKLLRRLSIYYGGGTFASLRDDCVYTGWEDAHCFRLDRELPIGHGTSKSLAKFPGGQLVATSDAVYTCGLPHGAGASQAVKAFKWRVPESDLSEQDKRRGDKPAPKPEPLWTNPLHSAECIILAGATLFVGAPDQVVAVDAAEGKTVWSAKIDGTALSLTVGAGRLFVSTDRGRIHCFAAKGAKSYGAVAQQVDSKLPASPAVLAAADSILKLAPDAKRGFAVVYGVETGELALELARRTELKIYAISPDASKVAAARKLIDRAGMYGGRVVVRQWPLERLPTTNYFADLVVSESTLNGKFAGSPTEAYRLTKPIRGKVVFGQATESFRAESSNPFLDWGKGTPLADSKNVTEHASWSAFTRPPLQGARSWTHQYGPPGATGSSEDDLVRAPFRVQWFGAPGPEHMVDRHYWAAAPLSFEGRMYVCSYKAVTAYDVYNGTKLWTYPLENAIRAHLADVPSNVAVGPDGYFVAVDEICYRLDHVTGKLLAKYKVPDAPKPAPVTDGKPSDDDGRRMWGYVAYQDGVLVGSRTLGYLPMEKWRKSRGDQVTKWLLSDVLFAIDVRSGKQLWQYDAPWFRHNNVVLGEGTTFVSVPGVTPQLQQAAADETQPFVNKFNAKEKQAVAKVRETPWAEILISFDLKTGKANWSRAVDWSTCGGQRGTLIYKNGLLLQLSDVGGCKAFNGYAFENNTGRSICVRSAETGDMIWLKSLNYRSRAVVVGETIYAEPWAYDLATGQQKLMEHPVTGQQVPWSFIRPEKHCGPFNASAHTLFFRSGGFGYLDVPRNEGVSRFESNRPSCWTSFISAGGLALWPTGDSGCRCNMAFQCSVALVHDDRNRVFSDFTCPGDLKPVKHLAINLGAAGDRRDKQGKLWLAYPRVKYTSAIELPIETEFYEGGAFDRRDSSWSQISETTEPWTFASWAGGLRRLHLALRNESSGPGKYRVELGFAAISDKPGQRVFDIRLQGKTVRHDVDIAKLAGAPGKAVFISLENVDVRKDLNIELIAKNPEPTSDQRPVLCRIEVTAH